MWPLLGRSAHAGEAALQSPTSAELRSCLQLSGRPSVRCALIPFNSTFNTLAKRSLWVANVRPRCRQGRHRCQGDNGVWGASEDGGHDLLKAAGRRAESKGHAGEAETPPCFDKSSAARVQRNLQLALA